MDKIFDSYTREEKKKRKRIPDGMSEEEYLFKKMMNPYWDADDDLYAQVSSKTGMFGNIGEKENNDEIPIFYWSDKHKTHLMFSIKSKQDVRSNEYDYITAFLKKEKVSSTAGKEITILYRSAPVATGIITFNIVGGYKMSLRPLPGWENVPLTAGDEKVEVNKGATQEKAVFDYFKHKVLANETLSEIATYYNVPVDRIVALNNLKENEQPAEGTIIKVPNPEKIKAEQEVEKKKAGTSVNKNPKDAEIDRLGLIDQKNQYLKVTADDFSNFLDLFQKYSLLEVDTNGNLSTADLNDPKELEKLKYIIGTLQDQNPEIKKYIEKAEKKLKAKGEEAKKALTPDKAIKFLKKLWDSGFLGKVAIVIPAAATATGAGYLRYKSVQLTLNGNNGNIGKVNELFDKLLDEVLFGKEFEIIKSKDIVGNVTSKPIQEELSATVESSENKQFELKVDEKSKFNSKINESDRNSWKEAGFDDKTIWYSLSNKEFYDVITFRHYIHQSKELKDSQVVNSSLITTVEKIVSMGQAEAADRFIFIKEGKAFTYEQILAMFYSKGIEGDTAVAKEANVKKVSEVEILASDVLYGKEFTTINSTLYGGFGLNKDFKPLNYRFGGNITIAFPLKKTTPYFSVYYNQEVAYKKLDQNLNNWSEQFVRDFMLKMGANYKFDIGDYHSQVGADISYKESFTSTSDVTTGKTADKNESQFLINPYFRISYDENKQPRSIYISPEFLIKDESFQTALNVGISGLRLRKSSFIKIDFTIKENKLDKGSIQILYLF